MLGQQNINSQILCYRFTGCRLWTVDHFSFYSCHCDRYWSWKCI